MRNITLFFSGLRALLPVFLLAAVLPPASYGAEPFKVTGRVNGPVIGSHMTALEDPAGKLTVEEVSSPPYSGQFRDFGNTAAMGFSSSAFWFRLELEGWADKTGPLYLTLSYPPLDTVDLYYPDGRGGYLEKKSGDAIPFHQRDVDFRMASFRILPAGEHTVLYLRVNALPADTITFTPRLWTEDEFNQFRTTDSIFMGVYYGLFMVMFFYNLIIYFSTQDRAYLIYVTYLLVVGFMMATMNGVGFQYLWSANIWLQNQGLLLLMSLALAVGVQFNRVFLDTSNTSPGFDKIFRGMIGLSFVCATAVFFVPYYYVSMTLGAVAFMLIFLLINAYSGMMRGYRPTRFYLFGWTVLIIGAIAMALRNYGILEENPFTAWGFQVGTALEVLLFSLALADRINEMKKMEEELKTEKEIAQTANYLKDKFMSLVAHDLRTPLSSISGFAELAMEEIDEGNGKNAKRLMQKTVENAENMERLVNSLLRSSRFKTGQVELSIEDLDAAVLASNIKGYLEAVAERKNVMIKNLIRPNTIVRADPVLFFEVLQNLVSNAIKFTPEGGEISIEPARRGDGLFIAVKDKGVGIKPEMIGRVFDLEHRSSTTGTNGEKGTGLGLPLCKDIVEAHGGEIVLESEPGKGTEVYVRFG